MTVNVNETVRNLADSVRRYMNETASQYRARGKHARPRWESRGAEFSRRIDEFRSEARAVATPAQKTAALATGASLLLGGMVYGVAEAAPKTLAERQVVDSQPLAAALVEKLPAEEASQEGAPQEGAPPAEAAAGEGTGTTAPVVEEPPSVPLDNLYVTAPFGWRINPMTGSGQEYHTGTDLRGATGTPVKAARAGTVVEAGWHTNGGGGLRIVVDHGDGLKTTYNHLSDIWVEPGQWVDTAHPVGAVGSTGNSTGPHLHFEMLVNGEYVDPMERI